MSTFVDLFPQTLDGEVLEQPAVEVVVEEPRLDSLTESFAQEQLRGLVRQVFLSSGPKPCRQVAFSAVDPQTDVLTICKQVGDALSAQVSAATCIVESHGRRIEDIGQGLVPSSSQRHFGSLQDSSRQLSSNLWFMPQEVFAAGNEKGMSGAWLRSRLAELRLEFEYTVLQGPPASSSSGAALLGGLCDGLVLILEANSTRRAAAQKVKQMLSAGNIRLLGTVLCERTFPIPEQIYRRL